MYGMYATDGYKLFHKTAYDKNITHVNSNMTSRSGRLSNIKDNEKVVFVGIQYFAMDFLIRELNEIFFDVPIEQAVVSFQRVAQAYLGGSYDVLHLEELWELGYLPISIKALPEGTLVPYNVPSIVIENTVAGFGWLVNYLESVMSAELWQMQTSATSSVAYFRTFIKAFAKTGASIDSIPFMGHDFSFRGMAGRHAAAASGFGHLASGFVGTDTIPALLFAEKYYGADLNNELVGCSVPATEHSTMTSSIIYKANTQGISYEEAEKQVFQELLKKVPTGIVSVVSDSFDFWSVVTKVLPTIKDEIMERDGTLVIRPDSGDPVDVLCGTSSGAVSVPPSEYTSFEGWKSWVQEDLSIKFDAELVADDPHYDQKERYLCGDQEYLVTYSPSLNRHDKTYYYVDNDYGDQSKYFNFEEVDKTPESKGLIECLWDIFGGTVTDEGYMLLDSHIGAIYGDSITHKRQEEICDKLIAKGFCPTVVLGIGSFTFQHVTRDTHGSAVKATNITINDTQDIAICKDPKTDSTKKSAKGLLRVEDEDGTLVLYDQQTRGQYKGGLLQEVFRDGEMTNLTTLTEIRDRVKSQL